MTPFTFLKTAVRDMHVGALTQSSTYVVDRVTRLLPSRCRVVVEYGPGDGVITRALLARLPGDARLIAIERNPTFASELSRIRDLRLTVIRGDVLVRSRDLGAFGCPPPDAVVSGIPLTILKPEERERLIAQTHRALRPDGHFLVYQYSPLVYPILHRIFSDVTIRFEPRNFLPYFIMDALK